MNFRRAVIHIGIHKTGTTSLQHVLSRHRALLSGEHDVCYPDFAANHGVWLYSIFSDTPHRYSPNIRAGINTLEDAREANRRRLLELQHTFEAAEESTLLLSGEDLSFLPSEGVRSFKRWIEAVAERLSIVLFLRDPISWSTSRTQEALRQRITLERAYEKRLSFRGLRDRLSPWLDEFGRQALAVVDYDSAMAHPRGIIGAFCELAGIPESFVQRVDISTWRNVSLSDLGARLLSELNRCRPFYIDGKINPQRSIDDHQPFEKIRGRPFRLPRDVLEQVIADSQVECEWLAENLGIRYSPTLSADRQPQSAVLNRAELQSIALTIADLHQSARAVVRQRSAMRSDTD